MNIEMTILSHQHKVLASRSGMTSMSCGRQAGKTFSMCLVAARDMLAGKKVLAIEPTNNNFRTVLEPAMSRVLGLMGVSPKFNKSNHTWTWGIGEIVTVSGESSERIRGITAVNTICIDECSSMDEDVLTLSVPTQSGLTVIDPQIYLFSTSTTKSHWFYRHSMKEGTNLIYASSMENVFAGQGYGERLLRQYEGLPDDFIQREVYGRFTDFSENTIFKEIRPGGIARRGFRCAGVDLALGGDYTSFVMFDGNVLAAMEKARTPTPADAERFIAHLCNLYRPVVVNYDCTGHGSYAEVEKWVCGATANPVNFGMQAGGRYQDMRTKIYFDLFFKMKDFAVNVPSDKYNELVEDLKATTIDDSERAKVKLIKKEEIRRLLGRSPDYGDAAALAAIPSGTVDYETHERLAAMNNPYRGRLYY